MSMKVLSIAFPFAPVGRGAVGGSEQIVAEMDRALVAAGHESIVVACEGSESAGTMYRVPLPAVEVLSEADRVWCRRRFQAAIDRAVGAHRVDLIHMHGLDFAEYTLPARVPVVVTLHLPIPWYGPEIRSWGNGPVEFCCVSESQRKTCPSRWRGLRVIENGVELPGADTAIERGDYAVVMGRVCPEKNAHEAMDAGTLAGVRVLLAGQVFPYQNHHEYFEQQIRPRVERADATVKHEFLGPVGLERRRELLSGARCLLHPTLAPETSSLVAMEAMAAGTPVIAYPSGALTEIVTEGETGFLVNGVEEMVAAIGRVNTISRERCRTEAQRRFGRERMVRQYFDLYEELVQRSQRRLYA